MQKKHFLFLLVCSLFIYSSFAQINSDEFSVSMPDNDSLYFTSEGLPEDSFHVELDFSDLLLALFAMAYTYLGIIGLYLCPSLGISLLSKKYTTNLHPVLSWIPVLRIYPFTKSAGISVWWSLSFLLPILLVYVFARLVKRTKRGRGYILGFLFFPYFMIVYLGLKEAGKSTWPAWIFGMSTTILIWSVIISYLRFF